MSFKVALLAVLAVFSTINAQLAVVDLVTQTNLLPACTTSSGCSILNVILSGSLTALSANSLLDFGGYNGVTINFDNPLLTALTIGAIAVNGTNNVVNFAVDTGVESLTVGASSAVVVNSGSTTLTVKNNVQATGAVVVGAGATIKVAAGAAGVIYQNAANLTVQAGGTVNSGVQVANGAAIYVGTSASASAQAAVVSGGVIVNGAANFGYATFQGAVVAGSSASASAQANIAVTVSAVSTFQSTFTASAQATVTVNAGAAIIAAGNVQSQGSVVVAGAINTTTATANYVQQASASGSATVASNLQLSGGSVNVAAGANIQLDGSLGGQGTLTGTLTGSGTLNIGNSPGTVFVNGDYKPGAASTFNLEVASAVSFDKLVVSGAAAINGNLNCILLNNYGPDANSRFTFITAKSISGQFLTVRGQGSDLLKWSQSGTATTYIANYNSAVTVAVSGLLVVVCLLASLL